MVISDSNSGKAYQTEVTGPKMGSIVGKHIGDTIDGKVVGLQDYKLLITGGTDGNGFPMRKDIPGSGRKKILVTSGTGYHPSANGRRKRKTMSGSEISSNTAQVNAKISEYGKKTIEELLKKEEE